MLLGNVAVRRASENKVLNYDSQRMRITNDADANDYLDKPYRPGFGLG